mmetsp:Transcript_5978/g.10615  ORF Transcript_5978/g.10615 Transcript_5978/m.10615 type:complete len:814 (-) Transcript_5978:1046-3487(-)
MKSDSGRKKLMMQVMRSCGSASSAANMLPSIEANEVVRLLSKDFSKAAATCSERIFTLLNKLCNSVVSLEKGQENADFDLLFEKVSSTTDEALDKAERLMNFSQKNSMHSQKKPAISYPPDSPSKRRSFDKKPQTKFVDFPIDNSRNPFVPKHIDFGVDKVNLFDDSVRSKLIDESIKYQVHRGAPLEAELYDSLDHTKFTYVNTLEALQNVIYEITEQIVRGEVTEIAIDLEAHSMRSFLGFTCLLQLSTRHEDVIIDTLELREHIQLLQPILGNPDVVKVLHGATSDIIWLQRDFGMWIVGLFDTCNACTALEFSSRSLGFLLKHYCNIDIMSTKKHFQRSDWRIRPLPSRMLNYARSDTHYLLYIYDRLRMELADRHQLKMVVEQSCQSAHAKYEKPKFKPRGWNRIPQRYGIKFDREQAIVASCVWDWRDSLARTYDESEFYILSNSSVVQMALLGEQARDSKRLVSAAIAGSAQRYLPSKVLEEMHNLAPMISEALQSVFDWSEVQDDTLEQSSTAPEPRRVCFNSESSESDASEIKVTSIEKEQETEAVSVPMTSKGSKSDSAPIRYALMDDFSTSEDSFEYFYSVVSRSGLFGAMPEAAIGGIVLPQRESVDSAWISSVEEISKRSKRWLGETNLPTEVLASDASLIPNESLIPMTSSDLKSPIKTAEPDVPASAPNKATMDSANGEIAAEKVDSSVKRTAQSVLKRYSTSAIVSKSQNKKKKLLDNVDKMRSVESAKIAADFESNPFDLRDQNVVNRNQKHQNPKSKATYNPYVSAEGNEPRERVKHGRVRPRTGSRSMSFIPKA